MSQTKAQLIDPVDGSLVNADISASAAIAGTKISPDFGSQNITTTGDVTSNGGDITISGASAILHLVDTNDNPNYRVQNIGGTFQIYDATSDASRINVNTDGHVDVVGNLDVGAGIDVTGAITGTGDMTIDTNTLHVDSSNNRVGIGTTSPTGILEIDSSSSTSQIMLDVSGTNYARIGHNTSGGSALLDIRSEGHARILANGNNTAVFVKSDLNVGIGTTTPSQKLDVDGSALIQGTLQVNDRLQIVETAPELLMSSPSGGLDSRILNDGSGNLIIGHGVNSDTPTERLRMLSGGAVLLGTTISPTSDKCSLGVAYLGNTSSGNVIELTQQTNGTDKAAAALGLAIANGGQSTNAADLFFATSLSGSLNTRMTIKDSGNVGIGLTNPSTELHVKDSSSDCLVRVESESGHDARLQLDTSNGGGAVAHLDFLMDGSTKGGIEYVNNASSSDVNCMIFRTTDLSERLKIDASGEIIAAKSIVSANLPGRNIIINGDMRVAQRATSATVSSSGNTYDVCDRWAYNRNGVTGTLAQVEEVPAGSGFKYSLKLTTTSAVGSIAAGNMISFAYAVETQDIRRLGYGSSDAKTATVSFWVRGSLSGKIGVNCTRDSRTFSTNEDIVANTWKFVEIVIPADTSTGFSQGDNSNGFNLAIRFAAGSNFTTGTTGGSWINFHTAYAAGFTAGQQGAYLTTNGSTMQVTGVQLEIGSKATPFEHKLFGEQLQNCRRYYQVILDRSTDSGDDSGLGGTVFASNGGVYVPIRFNPVMRSAPTVESSTFSNGFRTRHGDLVNFDSFSGFNTVSRRGGTLITASAGNKVVGDFYWIETDQGAAKLAVVAELT